MQWIWVLGVTDRVVYDKMRWYIFSPKTLGIIKPRFFPSTYCVDSRKIARLRERVKPMSSIRESKSTVWKWDMIIIMKFIPIFRSCDWWLPMSAECDWSALWCVEMLTGTSTIWMVMWWWVWETDFTQNSKIPWFLCANFSMDNAFTSFWHHRSWLYTTKDSYNVFKFVVS